MFDRDISILEKKLGFKFKNPKFIYIALTHKSHPSSGENNQRLEFLGDSILSAVITEYLYEKFSLFVFFVFADILLNNPQST